MSDKHPSAVSWYNPQGADDDGFDGVFKVTIQGDIDVGLLIGFDDQNGMDLGGPSHEVFADTNASINEVTVSHFSSYAGMGARAGDDDLHLEPRPGRSRIGVLVDDDQDGSVPLTSIESGCDSLAGPWDDNSSPILEDECHDRVRFNGGRLWVNDTGLAISDGFVNIDTYSDPPSAPEPLTDSRLRIEWSTGQGMEVNALDDGEDLHRNTAVTANEIWVLKTQKRSPDWMTALGPDDSGDDGDDPDDEPYYEDYAGYVGALDGLGSDNQMDGNGINVTGDQESREELINDEGPDEEFAKRAVLALTNGNIEANGSDGLAILHTDEEDGAVITANGTVFGGEGDVAENGNAENGIHLGTNNDIGGGPRTFDKYGATATFTTCTISENGDNGVLADDDADGTEETGIVNIFGGIVAHNGLNDMDHVGVAIIDTAVFESWGDVRAGHGILALGNGTLVTDSANGEASDPKLQVTENGFTGLWAWDGHMILSHTAFTFNGQNDVCTGGDVGGDEGTHGYGVGIHLAARMTMTTCEVDDNLGAGLVVNDDGYGTEGGSLEADTGEPQLAPAEQAKRPQFLTEDQANTVSNSTFRRNQGINDKSCTLEDVLPWPEDGVEVTRLGKLFFVDLPSRISFNEKNGLDVAGQLPLGAGAPEGAGPVEGDAYVTTEIYSDHNGIDGIVVSCTQTLEPNRETQSNDHGQLNPGAFNDRRLACGYARLAEGSSFENEENGVRVNGHLIWTEGHVYLNHMNGLVIDHADTAFPEDFYIEEGDDEGDLDEVVVRHNFALGWTPTAGEDQSGTDGPAAIRSRFFNMHVHENDENGYVVLSAPYAHEVNPATENCTADPELFDSTMDTDIESSVNLCVWGFDIEGSVGSINRNGKWGIVIGTDVEGDGEQDRNIFARVGTTDIFLNGTAGDGEDGGGIDVKQNPRFGGLVKTDEGTFENDQTACTRSYGLEDPTAAIRCQCDHSPKSRDVDDGSLPQAWLDTTVGCTATTIIGNNVYSNGGEGLRVKRSFQKPQADTVPGDRRVASSNRIHHNDVVPQEMNVCTAEMGAIQYSSQTLWIQPIGQADPNVDEPPAIELSVDCESDFDPGPPESGDPSASCHGPARDDYPQDWLCYWSHAKEPGDSLQPVATEPECNNVNNPTLPQVPVSGGFNNHCVFTGNRCRVGWDFGATEGATSACDSSQNIVFGYTNSSIPDDLVTHGVLALEGAAVRARGNQWGLGGDDDAFEVDGLPGSVVRAVTSCTGETRCVNYENAPVFDPADPPFETP
jgi:hypothetical protein